VLTKVYDKEVFSQPKYELLQDIESFSKIPKIKKSKFEELSTEPIKYTRKNP